MNDNAVRSLASLQTSGSSSRILNLLRVFKEHGLSEDHRAKPMFQNPVLNRGLIIKHRLRANERDLFPGRRTRATKILLPNPYGRETDYIDGLGLTQAEFKLIRHDLNPESRRFLIKQGHDSIVVELDLGGLTDELAVLSGTTETVTLLDAIRADVGDDPAKWLPLFHQQRRSASTRKG